MKIVLEIEGPGPDGPVRIGQWVDVGMPFVIHKVLSRWWIRPRAGGLVEMRIRGQVVRLEAGVLHLKIRTEGPPP